MAPSEKGRGACSGVYSVSHHQEMFTAPYLCYSPARGPGLSLPYFFFLLYLHLNRTSQRECPSAGTLRLPNDLLRRPTPDSLSALPLSTPPTPNQQNHGFPPVHLLFTQLCFDLWKEKEKKQKKNILSPSDSMRSLGERLNSCSAKKPPWAYLNLFFFSPTCFFSLSAAFSDSADSQGCGWDLSNPRFD